MGQSFEESIVDQRLREIEERFGVSASIAGLAIDEAIGEVIGDAVDEVVDEPASAPPLRPLARTGPFPLSSSQLRLWLMHQIDPASPEYVIPIGLRLYGALSRQALDRALQALVTRHEALRTRFFEQGATVLQEVSPPSAVECGFADLSHLPEPETSLTAFATREAGTGFDLTRAPLMRATLLRLKPDEHVLLLCVHHIVCDGWSVDILQRDFVAWYRHYADGIPAELPEQAASYRDFVDWQQTSLIGKELERLTGYWREALAGLRPSTLAGQRQRLPVRSGRGAGHHFIVGNSVLRKVREAANACNATPFMILAVAFATVLRRHGGGDDISLGTTLAGRHHEEFEDVVGLFANTAVLRVDLRGDPSFPDAVARVREAALGLYSHADMPFDRLVNLLEPERDLSRTPLYQVMLEFQGASPATPAAGGTRIEEVTIHRPTAKCDLALWMTERDGVLRGELQYSTDLFDEWFVHGLLADFTDVLKYLPGPGVERAGLTLPLDRKLRWRAAEWNATRVEFPERNLLLHQLFERQVPAAPGRAAVVADGRELSYQRLDALANDVAWRLRDLAVTAESTVAVCCERGAEFVVASIGVLKAGGGYVPLDTRFPAHRLAFMLADSGARVVVTQAAHRPLVDEVIAASGIAGVAVVDVDVAGEGRPKAPGAGAAPENLAYIMYTSGSTGKPKGVAVTHGGIVNYLCWMRQHFSVGRDDVILQYAPVGFDISVWEIFLALMTGATVVLPNADEHGDATALAALIDATGVTIAHFVPSVLNAMLAGFEKRTCGSLRDILCSAEPLTPDLVARSHKTFRARVWNIYGATEVSVDSTAHLCLPDAGSPTVPVGQPISNTEVYLLDAHQRLVPPGVAGEIYLAGDSVTRGYVNRPGLTAQRFVPDPFTTAPGARMYRTGDLGRQQPDGTLEFLGRLDHQIKIRGHRVEAGEIESHLRDHPAVARALVTTYTPQGHHHPQLVAYYTGDPVDPQQLRRHLATHLPDHMIPSHYLHLDALPLSPNGKVDRAALPTPQQHTTTVHTPPSTSTEHTLATIWNHILGVPTVNTTDNFFELGGDSILAIQLVGRAREQGLLLRPRDIFLNPTLGALASAVRALPATVSHPTGEPGGDVPLLPIQREFLDSGSPRPGHYNLVSFSDVAPGLSPADVERALKAMVKHHEALRARFERQGGRWRQSIAPAEDAGLLEVVEAGDPAERVAALDSAHQSLDLASGPLLRGVLLRGPGRTELALIVHHLVADIVSHRILQDDLATAVAQLLAGEPIRLAPVATPFSAWARRGGALAAGPETPQLHEAYPLSAERCVTVELTAEETGDLIREAARAYRTRPHEILLTALALASRETADQGELRVAVEGHGRDRGFAEDVDLSRTVGWLADVKPVVIDLNAGFDNPHQALCLTKELCRRVPVEMGEWAPDLAFEYLGHLAVSDDVGRRCDPGTRRLHPMTVESCVRDGRLEVHWRYPEGRHSREAIDALAQAHLRWVRQLTAHCRRSAARLTPSDVPLVRLGQAELDRLTARHRDVVDAYPLTPAQEGMLFHTIYAPESSTYLVQMRFRIEGTLDPARLGEAWRVVAARHPALRSSIVWEGYSQPVQVVHASGPPVIEVVDIPPESMAAYLASERAKGLDMAAHPVHRLTILRRGADNHELVWTFPHAMLDGWSVSVVMRELLEGYATPANRPAALPFRRYVEWIAEQDGEAANQYWQQVFGDLSAPTLMAQQPTPPGEQDAQESVHVEFTAGITRRVNEYARGNSVTVASVLLAGWALTASRHLDREDVTFGVTLAGRPGELPGVDSAAGMYINTLPMRLQVDENMSTADWIRAVQERHAELHDFEFSSLLEAQANSAMPRGVPMFDTIVVVANYPRIDHPAEAPLRAEPLGAEERTGYPLIVLVSVNERMRLELRYQPAAFDRRYAETLAATFARTIEQLTSTRSSLSDITTLTAAERDLLLNSFNATAADTPDTTVHGLFEEQAASAGDATAIVTAQGDRVSYRELNRRANQLAHMLRRRGAGPETFVGVCLPHSVDLFVALLGILKSGAAYLPLDPGFPLVRLEFMLADSATQLVVTSAEIQPALPPGVAETICLDRDRALIEAQPDTDPEPVADGGNLIYVMYTSGSTGRPKGVLISHRNLLNYLWWSRYGYGLEGASGAPMLGSIAFDLSIPNFFLPLIGGRDVTLLPPDRSLAALSELLRQPGEFSLLKLTPAHLDVLREMGQEQPIDSVRTFVVGGEELRGDTVLPWWRIAPNARIINEYGPTETVVGCSIYTIPPGTGTTSLPIGKPIANTRMYVLDRRLRPMPLGCIGELYIGGDGVARGYLGRAAVTAEKFLPDPYSPVPGARFYRSGDLARVRPDGDIEFLGRIDTQVKIRGYRIELGEIEACLHSHPGVAETVVVARQDRPGRRVLVAYAVPAGEQAPDRDEIRDWLRLRLPDYMVPIVVFIDAIPLSGGGKVDRAALPAPDHDHRDGAQPLREPASPAERALAEIWREILGRPRIDVRDDFFELGGDSILAIRVVSRARAQGFLIHPRDLFDHPVLAELASAMSLLPAADAEDNRHGTANLSDDELAIVRERLGMSG